MKFRLTINIPKWLDRLCAWPVVLYRKFKYGYPYRKITLNDGQFTIVDPDVYYRLNDFPWCAKGSNGRTYVVRFVTTPKNGTKTIYLHREITNAPHGKIVDHKNNDSLDNRIDNLRLATRSQNGCNSHIDKSKTSSKYRGVHFRKKSGKWAAAIRNKSEKVWLGSFQNELDAAHAYDSAAKKYHKVFAQLNFPEENSAESPVPRFP